MCWVAVDRAMRMAQKRSFPAELAKWIQVRDEIYEEVMEKGWSEERQAFMQAYGNDSLDASTLMMPLVFFVSPVDPRMLVDAGGDRPAYEGRRTCFGRPGVPL